MTQKSENAKNENLVSLTPSPLGEMLPNPKMNTFHYSISLYFKSQDFIKTTVSHMKVQDVKKKKKINVLRTSKLQTNSLHYQQELHNIYQVEMYELIKECATL